jgi:SAM-dependent methyltransferase
VIELLERETGLTPQWRIADIGSGTGLSATIFIDNGNEVFAVEPNREMREAAERLLGGEPRFHSVAARAEETTLDDGSIDLAVAAQAFHWFDVDAARTELLRILRPPGWTALLWNTRRIAGDDLHAGLEAVLLEFGTDYSRVRHDRRDPQRLRSFFGGPFTTHVLENAQLLDLDGLRGRVRSSSYVPAEGESGFDEMIRTVDALFAAHQRDGRVRLVYDLEVHIGAIVASRDRAL